jgi:hypothetical protein
MPVCKKCTQKSLIFDCLPVEMSLPSFVVVSLHCVLFFVVPCSRFLFPLVMMARITFFYCCCCYGGGGGGGGADAR